MKIVMIIVILVLVYLFTPQYVLYETEDSFSDTYVVKEKGFYSESSCNAKGDAQDRRYRCVSSSAWSEMFGKQQDYNKERQTD